MGACGSRAGHDWARALVCQPLTYRSIAVGRCPAACAVDCQWCNRNAGEGLLHTQEVAVSVSGVTPLALLISILGYVVRGSYVTAVLPPAWSSYARRASTFDMLMSDMYRRQ